ncbi:MAG: hypothetical protein WC780_11205 [Lentimicrobiaceae bacterium]|jgi:hypothetical protein
MEYQEIENLLNRYLEGETTLEEEIMLKKYFSEPGIPEQQRQMQEMFSYFAEAKQETAPPFNFTQEMNTLIENEWKKESANRFRRVLAWAGSAAAVLVISFGLFQYLNKPEPVVKDTFKDPKLAYIETKQALMMVSKVMNRNTANLKYLSKVDESFEQVQKVAKIDQIVNSVKNQEK